MSSSGPCWSDYPKYLVRRRRQAMHMINAFYRDSNSGRLGADHQQESNPPRPSNGSADSSVSLSSAMAAAHDDVRAMLLGRSSPGGRTSSEGPSPAFVSDVMLNTAGRNHTASDTAGPLGSKPLDESFGFAAQTAGETDAGGLEGLGQPLATNDAVDGIDGPLAGAMVDDDNVVDEAVVARDLMPDLDGHDNNSMSASIEVRMPAFVLRQSALGIVPVDFVGTSWWVAHFPMRRLLMVGESALNICCSLSVLLHCLQQSP
eukprot:scaffold100013_cov17-Prasinocladus_malaysianus.AAC.1